MTIEKEEIELHLLIENSITSRYTGPLQQYGGAPCLLCHTPTDGNEVRALLDKLWGKLLTAETLDDAFTTIMRGGAHDWPLAFFDAD